MKILFVTAWYPTPSNPVGGVFVREHARAVALSHDVTVLHVVNELDPGIRTWRVRREEEIQLTAGIPTFRVVRGRAASSYPAKVAAVARVARTFRPDVVHSHIYEAGVPGGLAAASLRRPAVVTEHWSGFAGGMLGWRQRMQAYASFGLARRVLPVSAQLRDAMQSYAPPRTHFEVVPNAVDTALFRPAESRAADAVRLLFTGILDAKNHKGVPLLLHALSLWDTARGRWSLDVVGDGPGRAACVQAAHDLGLTRNVTFHGARSKPEIARLMQEADLFLLPSRMENLPCVVIEALACGTPVVASDVGGIPELVSPRNGVLFPAGDVEALAQAIAEAIATPSRFDRAKIARDAAARFSLSSVGARLTQVYEDVTHGAGAVRPLQDPAAAQERSAA